MTGCERILQRLRQGPATAAELYALGVMVHSRVADLRKRGHVIVCEHIAGKTGTAGFEYRLLSGRGAEGSDGPPAEQPVPPVSRAGCSTLSGDISEKGALSRSVLSGNENMGSASPEQSAPVWLAHGPAASPVAGGPDSADTEDGAGAVQLSIEDAIEAAA